MAASASTDPPKVLTSFTRPKITCFYGRPYLILLYSPRSYFLASLADETSERETSHLTALVKQLSLSILAYALRFLNFLPHGSLQLSQFPTL